MPQPTVYSVGLRHPLAQQRPNPPEGMLAATPGGQPQLVCVFDRPSPAEVSAFRHQPLRLGLLPLLYGYVWLLQIDRMCEMEAPFSPHLEAPEDQALAPWPADGFPLLDFHLIDRQGIIAALRAATITPAFAGELKRLHALSLATPGFAPATWDRLIQEYQTRYARPGAAWDDAIAHTVAGARR